MHVLEKQERRYSGSLCTVRAMDHRIEICPDTKNIYQLPYRAVPQTK